MEQLSDTQVACIREHIRSTLHELESENLINLINPELKLRSIEITIVFVLTNIVQALPPSVYEDVKRLLDAREQLWKEIYSRYLLDE